MNRILTEYDVLYDNNPEIAERLCVTEDDKEQGYIADIFYCDPDYINVDGLKHPFIEIDGYVVTPYEYDDNVNDALIAFLDNKFTVAKERTWAEFFANPLAIAYRGGSGYTYRILIPTT